jgi:hypothetical protein
VRFRCHCYDSRQSWLESSWNVMAHGDARDGKWRGNRRMEMVASTHLARLVAWPTDRVRFRCHCYDSRQSWLESSWNVMAHGDAREGKWRGKGRMEWVASTLHTTSEHGVSSITTADVYTSAASSRLNWRTTAYLNELVRFAERRNLVSPRVPSHFESGLPTVFQRTPAYAQLVLSLIVPQEQKNENFTSSASFYKFLFPTKDQTF